MIIYFSGTGNSLSVARALAEATNDTLLPVCEAMKAEREFSDDRIGLVFPVYFFDIPDIIRLFLERDRFSDGAYLYAVVTCGGSAGRALASVDEILARRQQRLQYAAALTLPANSSKAFSSRAAYKLQSLQKERDAVARIIEDIRQEQGNRQALTGSVLGSLFHVGWLKRLGLRRFRVTVDNDLCQKCGLCQQICPVNAITVDESGASIGSSCSYCLACFHWCPYQAVLIHGRHARKEDQYHHPDISIGDMILRE